MENLENFDGILTLCDENGNDVDFQLLDVVEFEGSDYMVLLPCEDAEESDGAVIILKVESIDEDTGEETYAGVADEAVLEAVFAKFKKRLAKEFGEEE